jgi:nicotinate dehydrogenase subunit B
VYLATLQSPTAPSATDLVQQAEQLVQRAAALAPAPSAAQRQFEGSCGACHHDGDGPQLWGQNRPLALNSNLHSDRPDNVLRIILEGLQAPASAEMGFMPSFAQALTDQQMVEMVNWMRARYAPQQPAWTQTQDVLKAMRQP